MKKGIIKLQICDIWEIINKPHRFFQDITKKIEELPLGHYELLNLDAKTKKEILRRFEKLQKNFYKII